MVWIDTLCCPVKSEGKKYALECIADVYRNLTHTVVLDATLSTLVSHDIHPAELLLRILCSPWMRRLWTFQECALAPSLIIQFSDRAVSLNELGRQVYKAREGDIRYDRLWRDSCDELKNFSRFPPRSWSSHEDTQFILSWLQIALNSRSVSVPKDESLCIATLLGLDLTRILRENSAQNRMAAIWKMVAEKMHGIPPNVIFEVYNPLGVEGFRWAPRSLLAADAEGSQSVDTNNPSVGLMYQHSSITLASRGLRFTLDTNTTTAELVQHTNAKGLRGRYPGFRIEVKPHDGLNETYTEDALHPWRGLLPEISAVYNFVLFREESTGNWYELQDGHLERMMEEVLKEEACNPELAREWRLKIDQHLRLREQTFTGRCALIMSTISAAGLLAPIEREQDTELFVRRKLDLLVFQATEAESLVADTMLQLAAQLATEEITTTFIAQRSECLKENLIERMQQLVSEAWDARPDFAAAAIESDYFEDVRNCGWKFLARQFSHRASLVRTPDDQVWLVD